MITILCYDYHATNTIVYNDYYTMLRLLYYPTTTRRCYRLLEFPPGKVPISFRKYMFLVPGEVPRISENQYDLPPWRYPTFPKIHVVCPRGGPQISENRYVWFPVRSPDFRESILLAPGEVPRLSEVHILAP